MDTFYDIDLDDEVGFASLAAVAANATKAGAGGAGHYSLEQFTAAVRALVASARIDLRIDETLDGTRVLTVWQADMPAFKHQLPVDSLRLCTEEIGKVAAHIRRMIDRAGVAYLHMPEPHPGALASSA